MTGYYESKNHLYSAGINFATNIQSLAKAVNWHLMDPCTLIFFLISILTTLVILDGYSEFYSTSSEYLTKEVDSKIPLKYRTDAKVAIFIKVDHVSKPYMNYLIIKHVD